MSLRTITILAAWILALVALQAGYAVLFLPHVGNDPQTRGLFGDSFGALNAFISGCAFICLLFSLRQQEKSLADNQKDIEQQIALMTKQTNLSAEATNALTKQLRLMQLSSQLTALPTLVEAELVHLEVHHKNELGNAPIRTMTDIGILQLLKQAESDQVILETIANDPTAPIPATSKLIIHRPQLGHFICFVNNLRSLHEFKRDLFVLYKELAKKEEC